jgi:hypothetical protein|tara:strand:- start:518 stop:700 length:183 start_codon:yes stop_codon:yes gene_type:complete
MTLDKTFIKITNKDIYEKLIHIEEQVIKTNGSVGFHRKWLYALSVIIMAIIGAALSSAFK